MAQGLIIIATFASAAAVAIGIQFIPLVGILSNFLLSPMWPAAILNLMLASLALYAAARMLRPWWLLVPAVVWLGWAMFAWQAHNDALRMKEEIEAANRRIVAPLTHSNAFIVQMGGQEALSTARLLASVFDGVRIYASNRVYWTVEGSCEQVSASTGLREHGAAPAFDRDRSVSDALGRSYAVDYANACVVSRPEAMPGTGIALQRRLQTRTDGTNWYTTRLVRIDRGQEVETLGEIQQGRLSYPQPYPMFAVQCGLTAGCRVSLYPNRTLDVGYAGGFHWLDSGIDMAVQLARLLGIPVRPGLEK